MVQHLNLRQQHFSDSLSIAASMLASELEFDEVCNLLSARVRESHATE